MSPLLAFDNTDLPVNEYYDYFGPDYKLDVRSSNMEDRNSIEYLERIKNVVMEHLREIGGPPSVQMSGALVANSLFLEVWVASANLKSGGVWGR